MVYTKQHSFQSPTNHYMSQYYMKQDLSQETKSFKDSILNAQEKLITQIHHSLQHFTHTLLEKNQHSKMDQKAKIPNQMKEGPQKRFVFRESMLSIMFQTNDFRTIYNMFVASFIILTISLLYDSYIKEGEVVNLMALHKFFMGGETVVLAQLILVTLFSTIIIITKIALKTRYFVWVPLYILQVLSILKVATYFSQYQGMGFGSIMIIMSEAVRLIMKEHSYFRTKLLYLTNNPYRLFEVGNIGVINSGDNHDPENKTVQKFTQINIKDEQIITEIKKLAYFMFCPTLIYRDSYKLTEKRQIRTIMIHLINCIACIYYSFIMYSNWCKPVIQNLENKFSLSTLFSAIISLMLPSFIFMIMVFFGFLHSWMNLWSEILRFPDRSFYSDWWNSNQFGSYYRKWNIVVHDWLYYYIYLDLTRFFPKLRKIKWVPQMATFLFSAIMHEFIISYAIGFFYPILFILFAGPGIFFAQSKHLRKISVNLVFWLQMYIGMSIMFTFYMIEGFARHKIDSKFIQQNWGSLEKIVPRSLYLAN